MSTGVTVAVKAEGRAWNFTKNYEGRRSEAFCAYIYKDQHSLELVFVNIFTLPLRLELSSC